MSSDSIQCTHSLTPEVQNRSKFSNFEERLEDDGQCPNTSKSCVQHCTIVRICLSCHLTLFVKPGIGVYCVYNTDVANRVKELRLFFFRTITHSLE